MDVSMNCNSFSALNGDDDDNDDSKNNGGDDDKNYDDGHDDDNDDIHKDFNILSSHHTQYMLYSTVPDMLFITVNRAALIKLTI